MEAATLSEWSLPIPVAKGLIDGFVHVLGASAAQSLLQWSVLERFPEFAGNLPKQSDLASLNSLFPYYRDHYGTPIAVPYRDLILIRLGLDELYPAQASKLAFAIGFHWWIGEPPILQQRSQTDTLHYLLMSSLLEQLYIARRDSIARIHPLVPGELTTAPELAESSLLMQAISAFARTFQDASGITATVSVSSNQLIGIAFSRCPFCNNRLHSCNLLYGLFEAFLMWLYRVPSQEGIETAVEGYLLERTPKDGNSHSISLRLIPRQSKRKNWRHL